MYRIALLTIAGIVASAGPVAAESEIYKRELPDGSVIYSDQPHPEAEKVEPGEPQVVPSFRSAPPARPRTGQETPFRYEHLEITAPTEDQVIWSDPGVLEVGISLEPGLRANHTLRILMDGEVVIETSAPGNRFTLDNVFRGTHTLKAAVEDRTETTLIEAAPVTFHLKQHSILSPTRPQ